MKFLKIGFLASASYAAMAVSAYADPLSLTLGNAIFAGLYAIGVPGAVANFVAVHGLTVAALAGGLGASLAARRGVSAAVTSDVKNTFETGESSVLEGVGRVRVGGLKAFGNTDGSTRARLVCRLQGPVDAVEAYYLGQREVTVDPGGEVSSPPWARPGGSWCNWQDKSGTGEETAWSGLTSLFPGVWTADHRVRGIAQSLLLFYNPGLSSEKYLSLYQGGVPDSEWIARASLVYDPRDEAQEADDPSTWKWSDNSICILAHVLRRDPAFAADRFDWSLIAAEADRADAPVPTLTGTEKRSRLWGVWQWEATRSDTMQQFLDSAGAEIRMTAEGKIWFELIDDEVTLEIDFSPLDIYDFSWKSGPEAVERPNVCRLSYYSPEQNYDLAEINLDGIAWAQIDDEVEKYGPKYEDIDLPFCPSASQGQRIGRRKFALARTASGTIITNMVGLAAWGLLYAGIEEPDLGDVEKVRMQPPRIDDENGSVEIPFAVWPQLDPWNPAEHEAPAPEAIPELGFESDMITPDAPTAAVQITYPGGGKEMRIGYTLPSQTYNIVEAVYRTYAGAVPNAWTGMTEVTGMAWAAADLLGQTIDARVRVFNGDDGSYFSPLLNAAVVEDNVAPAAPTRVSGGVTSSTGGQQTNYTLSAVIRANGLNVAALVLERREDAGVWGTVSQINARTATEYTITDSLSRPEDVMVSWQVVAISSDGTRSATVSIPIISSS